MRAAEPAWRGVRALWAVLCLALSLAIAPTVEAVKHGPGAMAAEAEHRAFHAAHGHSHDIAGSDHHDSATTTMSALRCSRRPERKSPRHPSGRCARLLVASGTIRDGPRRPPRLTLI